MSQVNSKQDGMIAAERRRQIYLLALQNGSVKVSDLANQLNVRPITIRKDLEVLQQQGKIVRARGGATVSGQADDLQYNQMREMHTEKKAQIGERALDYLPETGIIYIAPGSTTYQMACRLPVSRHISVFTAALDIASCVISKGVDNVAFVGGYISKDTFASDWAFAEGVLEKLWWDVAFVGIEGIDIERGLTARNFLASQLERKVMEHSECVVALCDSSKFGLRMNARIGPVSLIHVLITDSDIKRDAVERLTDQGVHVVVADASDIDHAR